MADPLILDWTLQIIIASVSATISGVILLLLHHSRVKQELEIHRKKEIFERKQKMYRKLLNHIEERLDYVFFLGNDLDWREVRLIYNELMLSGAKPVIDAFNNFLKTYNPQNPKDDEKFKKILVEIRKDLYGDVISVSDVKVVNPGSKILDELEILGNHKEILANEGFENFESLSKMDIDMIHAKTSIDKADLQQIKHVAEKEHKSLVNLKNSILEFE
ncbi:MAG: hypothetical protein HZA84_09330 [Thaumarchaeota archaeon]|nr:hypothetical protein [Nitrososphaerota archaeon]